MTERKWLVFNFADVEVREREFSIARGGEVLSVEPKAFRVLLFLLRNPHKLIAKEELLDAVWGDTAVSENSLTRSIALLRKLLGDDTHEPRFIATIPTVGYRFLCDVRVTEDGFEPAGTVGVLTESPSEPGSSASQSRPAKKGDRRHGMQMVVALAAFILLVGAGWFVYKKWRTSAPTQSVQRALTQLTFDEGHQTGATWSPDGRFIAYSSDRGGKYDIWIQQVSGGDPIQITKGPGENWQPDWSPDGKYIAFRSEDGGGGIYIMPALGTDGSKYKIASFGYYPHWSPDSSRILFQGRLASFKDPYVVGLDGSPPHAVLTAMRAHTRLNFSAWHPDAKRITAWVSDLNLTPNFLTGPIEGGPVIETKFTPELRKQFEAIAAEAGVPEWSQDFRFAWAPSGLAIYFERTFRGSKNIWRLAVNSVTLQPTALERLITSPGLHADLSLSPDGTRLAFTNEHQLVRAWVFPFDARHAHVSGTGQPVTSPGIQAWMVNLSQDCKKLAIWASRGGQNGAWETSILDRHEESFAINSDISSPPVWSPDGRRAAYRKLFGSSKQTQAIVVWAHDTRNEELVGAPGISWDNVNDWSPDGKSLLLTQLNHATSHYQISLLPLTGRPLAEEETQKLVSAPDYHLFQPHFSKDGRWIAFQAVKADHQPFESTINVVPASGGPWIRITDGKQWDDKPRWSPDGKFIYFLSEHDGFFNLWGIRFDPTKGQPQGKPFPITSFDHPYLMIPRSADISLCEDHLVFPLAQVSGNIWILDNVDH